MTDRIIDGGGRVFKDLLKGTFFELGSLLTFGFESMRWLLKRPFRFGEIIRQIEFVGNQSIFIIFLTGLFTGMVFAFQAWTGFKIVNAENLVGATTALAIVRELGPVLCGLIISARAGGAMAARLGTMRVTEQIDALEVMGIEPRNYLVAPRIVAATIGMPLLVAVFDFVSMIGAWLFSVKFLELDEGVFWDKISQWTDPKDLIEGMLKGAIFGFMFAIICTYTGFNTEGGAKGVGDATNKGVVTSMVAIIVADFFITKVYRIFIHWIL
jgi:phospholipid/cholesterol/gamma-HCH transport system permease protein